MVETTEPAIEALGLTETTVQESDPRRDLLVIAGFIVTVAAILAFAIPFASAVSDFGDSCLVAFAYYLGPDPVSGGAPAIVCDSPAERAAIWLPLTCAVLAAASGLLLTLAARYRPWALRGAIAALLLAVLVFLIGSALIGGLDG